MKNLSIARRVLVIIAVSMVSLPSSASGEKKADADAQKPMSFLVNIGRTPASMRFLRADVVLEYANEVAAAHFGAARPKLMHHIIMQLSDSEVDAVATVEGKRDLQQRVGASLNEVFGATRETGVRDVFFTDFIVQ